MLTELLQPSPLHQIPKHFVHIRQFSPKVNVVLLVDQGDLDICHVNLTHTTVGKDMRERTCIILRTVRTVPKTESTGVRLAASARLRAWKMAMPKES